MAGGSSSMNIAKPVNLISLISVSIFILALLAAGGVFGYSWHLTQGINTMREELVAARSSFDNKLFDEFIRLDTRLNSAHELLNNHVASSLLFEALQNMTVKAVQFKEFNYKTADSPFIEVTMRGEATSYNAIALQSVVFKKNKYIRNALFSDMDLNDKGNITFNFKAEVDRDLVAHKNATDSLSLMYEMSADENGGEN